MDSNKVVKPLKKEFVRSYGYEWEVPFDSFYEDYEYHHLGLNDER